MVRQRCFRLELEDDVAEDNPVRVIDFFVDQHDLRELGFSAVVPKETGRPAYHPAVKLKIYVYGYLNRVQSSRRLRAGVGPRNIPRDLQNPDLLVPPSTDHGPDPSELYIFSAPVPGTLASDMIAGATSAPQSLSYRLLAQEPIKMKGGAVRIANSKVFPASKNIAAALVEVEPGGMRELHWHPNTDEWQYYIEGKARMGVFAASGQARTFDFQAGDVGYVPFAMGHYVENTATSPLRFLEIFKSSYFADVSLNQWMALTPPELVSAHLKLDAQVMNALRKDKAPVVPA